MDQKDTIQLQILEEMESKGDFTQRELAQKLNIALGLSNAYIRRIIEKGYVMVSKMPRKRVFYNLTPKGIAEKSRLTLLYMKDSLNYYRMLRQAIETTLQGLLSHGLRRLVILGTGEIAEIAYILIRQTSLELVAVVEIQRKTTTFLGLEVTGAERLSQKDYDVILLAEESIEGNKQLAEAILKHQLPAEKIVSFTGQRLKITAGLEIELPGDGPSSSEKGS